MASMCIFALRDVIRKVQKEFQTPYNSNSHTSPSTETDIKVIREYLEAQHIQSYHPTCQNNEYATEAHDLIEIGSEYANTLSAFRNFIHTKYEFTNLGIPEGATIHNTETSRDYENDDQDEINLGANIELDDLVIDDDEFPPGTELGDYVGMMHEVIDELSHYD